MESVRFTTKSVIIGENRFRVIYTMEGEKLTVTEKEKKEVLFTLSPADGEAYKSAMAAFQLKQEKRAAAADQPREAPDRSFVGTRLKGDGYEIFFDGSIDRATVTFKRAPSAAVRELVKAAGFWWTPSHKCWSRKLTCKAWRAGQELHMQLAH